MERLQGQINSCYIGEHLDVNLLECCSLGQGFVSTQEGGNYHQEEDYYYSHFSPANSLLLEEEKDNKMPFLQMLQSVELPPFFPLKEPSFQALLNLQHAKSPCLGDISFSPSSITDPPLQYSSSSPVKSEIFDLQNPPSIGPSISQEQVPNSLQDPSHCTREKRKRKRTKPTKNKEEVESQRMTHIAVERNRRRLMNEHLSSLRALMPSSYALRGDQASIVGGAIDFVKELEQLLQSLEAQKRIRRTEEADVSQLCHVNSQIPVNGHDQGGVQARQRSEVAEIEVTVIQNHVNLKVHCQRKPSQLVRAVVALEELRLTVLHLNLTSSYTRVLYTFNLKMEEECKLGSADEVVGAVHQIFSIINGC